MTRAVLTFLPILTFLLIFTARLKLPLNGGAAGFLFLETCAVWGCLVTAATEIPSLFGSFRIQTVAGFWCIAVLAAGACVVASRVRMAAVYDSIKNSFSKFRFSSAGLILSTFFGALFLGTFLTAVQAAPNTADSMTYHLSRIAHWIQNGSVAHYPTNILRQLFQSPWAEFAIAQFQLLSDTDRMANLIQWFAFPSSLIAIILLSRELGLGRKETAAAMIFFATAPMTLLQAATTQNDLVAAFWTLCLAAFFFRYLRTGVPIHAWMSGLALGLAVSTKQTALMFAFPLAFGFTVAAFKKYGRRALLPLAVIGLIVLGINAGHWARNEALFGSPAGVNPAAAAQTLDGQLSNYRNEGLTAPMLASNILRNVVIHAGTPFPSVNRAIESGVVAVHGWLGVGLTDPRNNGVASEPYTLEGLNANEDIAGNPIQAALLFLFVFAFILTRELRGRTFVLYSAALAAGFLIFCAAIKWMPYHTRLHLPLFALASPLAGSLIRRPGWRVPASALLVLSALVSFYWIGWSPLRPWTGPQSIWKTGRVEQYFMNRPYLRDSYLRLAEEAKNRGWKRIGILTRHSDFEYPLWVLLKKNHVRVEHVNVPNPSARLSKSGFEPDALIMTGLTGRLSKRELSELAAKYRRREILGSLYVFDDKNADQYTLNSTSASSS